MRSLWAVLQVYWESWEVGCPWGSCVPMWQCRFSSWDSSLCWAVSEHWLTFTAQHCEWMGCCVHLLQQSSIRVLFHVPLLMESWWNLIKESRCIRTFFLTFLGHLSNYTLLKAIDFSCLPRYNLVHINVVYLPQLKHHIQVWTNKLLMNGMLKTTPCYWRQFIFSCSLRYNLVLIFVHLPQCLNPHITSQVWTNKLLMNAMICQGWPICYSCVILGLFYAQDTQVPPDHSLHACRPPYEALCLSSLWLDLSPLHKQKKLGQNWVRFLCSKTLGKD